MLKTYEVSYNGSYMGGCAIIRAETPEQAIEYVAELNPMNFTDVEVEEIKIKRGVLYNWDGEY